MKSRKVVKRPVAWRALSIGIVVFITMVCAGATPRPTALPKEGDVIVLTDKNTVNLNLAISDDSAKTVQLKLIEKSNKLSTNEPIYLFLSSPGGSIDAGNAIIETAQGLPQKVHTITNYAASMAFQIAQALHTRYILKTATLMSHRAYASGLSGSIPGSLLGRAQFLEDQLAEADAKIAARAGITLKAYQDLVADELWMTAESAKKYKMADRVVTARCDKSLSGTETSKFQVMIFTVKVQFSKCPLVTAPISVEFEAPEDKSGKKAPEYSEYPKAVEVVEKLLRNKRAFVEDYVLTGKVKDFLK